MLGTLIGLTIFIVIGSIGKTQNELKAIIKEAEVYLNNGEISGAENVLRAKAGETNNREFKKLWSIAYGYEQASNKLYLYDDIEGTKEMLDKIDNSYKNYEPVKEKIDKLIGDMESIELVRAEADNVIEQVEKLLEDNKPEEALEIVYEIEGKEGQTKKQKDKLLSLRVKSEDMKWANIDLERERKKEKNKMKNLQQIKQLSMQKTIVLDITQIQLEQKLMKLHNMMKTEENIIMQEFT